MQTAIRMTAPVLPGKRIEVTAPELPDGATVELIIMLPEVSSYGNAAAARFQGPADYLASLPRIQRTPEEWAEIEREFQAERDAWDR